MIKIVKALLVVNLIVGAGFAYEIKSNPDQRISLGVNYQRKDMSGKYTSSLFNSNKDFGNFSSDNIVVDMRIPLTSFLTFNAGGGYSKTSLGLGIIDIGERWNMSGYNLMAGIRFYLP